MNDSPLLNKMDALMKKHRGSSDAEATAPAPTPSAISPDAPPPGAWLPVLTDVIERGTPPSAAAPRPAIQQATKAAPLGAAPVAPPEPQPAAAKAVADDTLAEQLLSELAPKLSEAMEKQVAAELRKNLDQIVRDAVAEKLRQPREPSS